MYNLFHMPLFNMHIKGHFIVLKTFYNYPKIETTWQ